MTGRSRVTRTASRHPAPHRPSVAGNRRRGRPHAPRRPRPPRPARAAASVRRAQHRHVRRRGPATQRATVSRLRRSISSSSTAVRRGRHQRGPAGAGRSPDPSATHSRAVPITGGAPPRRAPRRAGPRRAAPTRRPAGRASSPARDPGDPERARVRPVAVVARPGTSGPRQDTTPHGSTVRRLTSPAGPPRRWGNVTARPACTAASRGPNAGSTARTRACTGPPVSSTSTPAARSLTTAPCAAPASPGVSHSRAASATAAASSGSRSISPELVVVAGDAVAVGGVEPGVAAGLQRDAQLAQLGLVALEHAEERLVRRGVGVAGDGGADLLGGQELPGGQQAEHQVHQTLGPGGGHVRHRTAAGRSLVAGLGRRARAASHPATPR